jgi:hypothetical protein
VSASRSCLLKLRRTVWDGSESRRATERALPSSVTTWSVAVPGTRRPNQQQTFKSLNSHCLLSPFQTCPCILTASYNSAFTINPTAQGHILSNPPPHFRNSFQLYQVSCPSPQHTDQYLYPNPTAGSPPARRFPKDPLLGTRSTSLFAGAPVPDLAGFQGRKPLSGAPVLVGLITLAIHTGLELPDLSSRMQAEESGFSFRLQQEMFLYCVAPVRLPASDSAVAGGGWSGAPALHAV